MQATFKCMVDPFSFRESMRQRTTSQWAGGLKSISVLYSQRRTRER